MDFTAEELATLLKGSVDGNPAERVTSFAGIEHGKPGRLCFFANPKYEHYVYETSASAIIVNKDFVPKEPVRATLIRVDDAYSSVASLLKYVHEHESKFRYHRSLLSWIYPSARLGKKVYVGSFTYIGRKCRIGDGTRIYQNVYIGDGTTIGKECILYPGVRIYPGMIIGDRVILHANCVVGSDGFGNAPQPDGSWKKIEHLGNVIIGNDVEIGANTTVDRAEMESTVIGNGVKIDNLCQIAHNVRIGDNTVMAAQVGIAGSTKIGRNCIIAGQVGIIGHLTIADGTTIAAQAGVIGNVKQSGQKIFGTPAIDINNYMRSYAIFKQNGKR